MDKNKDFSGASQAGEDSALADEASNFSRLAAITEAPYDRATLNELETVFGRAFVAEKSETLNKSVLLKSALSSASKSGRGSGIPDGVVFLDSEYRSPFMLVEVKAPNRMGQAWKDLTHYAVELMKASVIVPFALAVSGSQVELRKFNPETQTHDPIEIRDVTLEQNYPLKLVRVADLAQHRERLKELYLRNDFIVRINVPGFTQDQITQFCVAANKRFHNMGIKEETRATILTYFLVCCLDKKFVDQLDRFEDLDDLAGLSEKAFNRRIQQKAFRLNKNIFSIFSSESQQDWSKSDRENHEKYMRAVLAIFELIDQFLAGDFKGLCENRREFVKRLVQSGNFLGDAYEVFHTYTVGNDMGQYFTPRHAVELMISVIEELRGASINVDDIVYDPACGVGGFLCLALKHATSPFEDEEERQNILERLGQRIYGSEIEPTVADMAKVNMLLRGDGKSGIVTGSSLDKDYPNGLSPIKERFKRDKVQPSLVLMNPPFPSKNSTFKSYEFITHALEVSAEGAFIGAIIPLSVINGRSTAKFRRETLGRARLRAVITLPPDLFEPKASADTAIVILQKASHGHRADMGVVFASCTSDGMQMHRGQKQRLSDFNTPNEFRLLCNHWLPGTDEVFEKFVRRNPLAEGQMFKDYFLKGGEWSPPQWLNDNPLLTNDDELARLARHVMVDYEYAKNIRNLGGKW